MSLDVCLVYKNKCVFDANITHNLNNMAMVCGVYYACWRPEEINCKKAKHIFPMLNLGIELLITHKKFYKTFNPPNGWGSYEGFLSWLIAYKNACEKWPTSNIEVSR